MPSAIIPIFVKYKDKMAIRERLWCDFVMYFEKGSTCRMDSF